MNATSTTTFQHQVQTAACQRTSSVSVQPMFKGNYVLPYGGISFYGKGQLVNAVETFRLEFQRLGLDFTPFEELVADAVAQVLADMA